MRWPPAWSFVTPELALARLSVEVLRPSAVTATGLLGADGCFAFTGGDGLAAASIPARQLANALAELVALGPRPNPVEHDLLTCSRAGLDLLLGGGTPPDDLLSLLFGAELGPPARAELSALAGGPLLHWRACLRFAPDCRRTCEIVDGRDNGLWRIAVLVARVAAADVWLRLSRLVPSEDERGD